MRFLETKRKVMQQFNHLLLGLNLYEKEEICEDGEHCPTRTWAGGAAAVHRHYHRYLESRFFNPWFGADVGLTPNRVSFNPIDINEIVTVDGIIVLDASVVAGNIYVALYDSINEAPVNRLAVSNSVAVAGTRRKQYVAFTAQVQLTPAYYFVTVEPDDATRMYQHSGELHEPAGIANGPSFYYQDMGAYLIPPAVATPVQSDLDIRNPDMMLRVVSTP